jgi:hypothetical protein
MCSSFNYLLTRYFGCIDMLMQDNRPLIWPKVMGHCFAQFWFQIMFSGLQATPENQVFKLHQKTEGHVLTTKIGRL